MITSQQKFKSYINLTHGIKVFRGKVVYATDKRNDRWHVNGICDNLIYETRPINVD